MSSLGKKAVSGVLWTTGVNVFRDVVQFGVMLALVRLLPQEAYGKFSLVTAIMGFLSVFSYRVFLEHTLQVRPGDEVDYQMHFTAGAVIQVTLFFGTNLFAFFLRRFGTYAPVAPLVHIMSILFLLDLGNEFRVKMLERELDWKRLRILQSIGVAANALLAVIMATAGAGPYALLVPSLLAAVPTGVDLLFIQRWRPKWTWNAAAFKPARDYGLTRFMSALVLWSRQLMEGMILVRLAGYALYGVYGRALGLAALCCLRVPSLLAQSMFPVLTKLDPGSAATNRASALVFCSVAWSTFPAAFIFSRLAPAVVHTLYGNRWSGAIPFIPWAMVAGTAAALAQTGDLLLVSGRHQKRSLVIDLIILTGTAVCLFALAPRSLKLYLFGTACLQTTAFLLMLVWLHRLHVIDFKNIAGSLIPPAVAVGIGYLSLEALGTWVQISRDTFGGAVVYGMLFAVIYIFVLRLTSGRLCSEVLHFLPGGSYLQRWLLLEA